MEEHEEDSDNDALDDGHTAEVGEALSVDLMSFGDQDCDADAGDEFSKEFERRHKEAFALNDCVTLLRKKTVAMRKFQSVLGKVKPVETKPGAHPAAAADMLAEFNDLYIKMLSEKNGQLSLLKEKAMKNTQRLQEVINEKNEFIAYLQAELENWKMHNDNFAAPADAHHMHTEFKKKVTPQIQALRTGLRSIASTVKYEMTLVGVYMSSMQGQLLGLTEVVVSGTPPNMYEDRQSALVSDVVTLARRVASVLDVTCPEDDAMDTVNVRLSRVVAQMDGMVKRLELRSKMKSTTGGHSPPEKRRTLWVGGGGGGASPLPKAGARDVACQHGETSSGAVQAAERRCQDLETNMNALLHVVSSHSVITSKPKAVVGARALKDHPPVLSPKGEKPTQHQSKSEISPPFPGSPPNKRLSEITPFPSLTANTTLERVNKAKVVLETMNLTPAERISMEHAIAKAEQVQHAAATLNMRNVAAKIMEKRQVEILHKQYNLHVVLVARHLYCHACGKGPFVAAQTFSCDSCFTKLYKKDVHEHKKVGETTATKTRAVSYEDEKKFKFFYERLANQKKKREEESARIMERLNEEREKVFMHMCGVLSSKAASLKISSASPPGQTTTPPLGQLMWSTKNGPLHSAQQTAKNATGAYTVGPRGKGYGLPVVAPGYRNVPHVVGDLPIMERLLKEIAEHIITSVDVDVTLDSLFDAFSAMPPVPTTLLVDAHTWPHVVTCLRREHSGVVVGGEGEVWLHPSTMHRILGLPIGVQLGRGANLTILQRIYAAGGDGVSFVALARATSLNAARVSTAVGFFVNMGCVRTWGSATHKYATHNSYPLLENETHASVHAIAYGATLVKIAENKRMRKEDAVRTYETIRGDAMTKSEKRSFRDQLYRDPRVVSTVTRGAGLVVEVVAEALQNAATMPRVEPVIQQESRFPLSAMVFAAVHAADGRAVIVASISSLFGVNTDRLLTEGVHGLKLTRYNRHRQNYSAYYDERLGYVPAVAVECIGLFPRWEFVEFARNAAGDVADDGEGTDSSLFLSRAQLVVDIVYSSEYRAMLLNQVKETLTLLEKPKVITYRTFQLIIDYLIQRRELKELLPGGIRRILGDPDVDEGEISVSLLAGTAKKVPTTELEVLLLFPPRPRRVFDHASAEESRFFALANGYHDQKQRRCHILHAYVLHLTLVCNTSTHNVSDLLRHMPMAVYCQVIGYVSGMFPKEYMFVSLEDYFGAHELRARAVHMLRDMWVTLETHGAITRVHHSGVLISIVATSSDDFLSTQSLAKYWENVQGGLMRSGGRFAVSRVQLAALHAFQDENPTPTLDQCRTLCQKLVVSLTLVVTICYQSAERKTYTKREMKDASAFIYDKRPGAMHRSDRRQKRRRREGHRDPNVRLTRNQPEDTITDIATFLRVAAEHADLSTGEIDWGRAAAQLGHTEITFIKTCRLFRTQHAHAIDFLIGIRVWCHMEKMTDEETKLRVEDAVNIIMKPESFLATPPGATIPDTLAELSERFVSFNRKRYRGGKKDVDELFQEEAGAAQPVLQALIRAILLTPSPTYSSHAGATLLSHFSGMEYTHAAGALRSAGVTKKWTADERLRLAKIQIQTKSLSSHTYFHKEVLAGTSQENMAALTHGVMFSGRLHATVNTETGGGVEVVEVKEDWEVPFDQLILRYGGPRPPPTVEAMEATLPPPDEGVLQRVVAVVEAARERGVTAADIMEPDVLAYLVATGALLHSGQGTFVHPSHWSVRSGHGVSVFKSISASGEGWNDTEMNRVRALTVDYVMGNPGAPEHVIATAKLNIYTIEEVRIILGLLVDDGVLSVQYVQPRALGFGGRMPLPPQPLVGCYHVNVDGLWGATV